MKRNPFEKKRWLFCYLIILLFITSIACAPQNAPAPRSADTSKMEAASITASWEMEWERLVKEAKKEQWLSIISSSSGEIRLALTNAMKDKFDIKVDWLTSRGLETQAKILAENKVGLKTTDIIISGSTTGFALKGHNIIEPLDKILLIPEVLDESKWYEGKFPWWDKEHMVITPLIGITPIVGINTELVSEKEVTSYRDLLNPKWKGKISMTSPLIGGNGLAAFGMVGQFIMGWDYFKELAKQEPVVMTDTRLGVEWLARGKQAIGWAARSESVIEFQKLGAPIRHLKMSEGTYASDAGTGFIKLKDSPHRAASIVFINWLLTREGQKVFSEARGIESNRLDVSKDHIEPIRIRLPGVKYPTQDEKTRALEDDWKLKAKEILGHLMK